MSALGLDDVNDPRGVLAFAPRTARRAADDETTIRPVLERLSKSEGRVPGPRLVRKAAVQDLPPPQVETVAKSAFPMVARFAVAAGVLALVGAAAAGYMAPLTSEHAAQSTMPAAPASTALPKPVQTVSIQRPADAAQPAAKILKDDARMPQPAPAASAEASAPVGAAPAMPLQRTAATDPSLAPLKSWAAVPAEGAGWSPPPQPAATDARAAADETPPAKPEAKQPAHKASSGHHTRHAARHRVRHHRRSRTARAPAAPQPSGQAAQAAEAPAAPAQPVKKLPLQAAIDRMFGSGGAAAGATPQAQPQR